MKYFGFVNKNWSRSACSFMIYSNDPHGCPWIQTWILQEDGEQVPHMGVKGPVVSGAGVRGNRSPVILVFCSILFLSRKPMTIDTSTRRCCGAARGDHPLNMGARRVTLSSLIWSVFSFSSVPRNKNPFQEVSLCSCRTVPGLKNNNAWDRRWWGSSSCLSRFSLRNVPETR